MEVLQTVNNNNYEFHRVFRKINGSKEHSQECVETQSEGQSDASIEVLEPEYNANPFKATMNLKNKAESAVFVGSSSGVKTSSSTHNGSIMQSAISPEELAQNNHNISVSSNQSNNNSNKNNNSFNKFKTVSNHENSQNENIQNHNHSQVSNNSKNMNSSLDYFKEHASISPAVRALDNVLSYLDRSPEKICLAEAQGLGFLMNPRLREILAVHDQLKQSQVEKEVEKRQHVEEMCGVDEVLFELEQENVSFLENTHHLVHLLSAYQKISTNHLNLPNLNDFNLQMDENMKEIERIYREDDDWETEQAETAGNKSNSSQLSEKENFDEIFGKSTKKFQSMKNSKSSSNQSFKPQKLISMDKVPGQKLGVTIKQNEEGQIIIGRVLKGEKADLSGLIHPGDIIERINDVDLTDYTAEEVIKLVAKTQGSLDIVILPQQDTSMNDTIITQNGDIVTEKSRHFMKSRINWESAKDKGLPVDDDSITIKISVGDVLEILSKDESNWWQARKVGSVFEEACGIFNEPGPTGLIPSPFLLEKRVKAKHLTSPKRGINGANETNLNVTTTSSVENSPKKGKNSTRNTIMRKFSMKKRTGSSLSLNTKMQVKLNEPYTEMNKIGTQEMKLRPIIIIGARGIGTSEFKDRLIDANPSLYDSPIPHTSRTPLINEKDGRDYHFVEKNELEKMIDQDQLIEWGTYGNNYYGTSTDAIRAIKFNGKVALMSPMNLDQAMSRLHTASIQSFVVFITVPESLKDGGVEDCEFEDDELSDIQGKEHERLVEQSREIFRKFNGQIDRVIVKRDFESCFNQLEGISFSLMNDQQWVPSRWIK